MKLKGVGSPTRWRVASTAALGVVLGAFLLPTSAGAAPSLIVSQVQPEPLVRVDLATGKVTHVLAVSDPATDLFGTNYSPYGVAVAADGRIFSADSGSGIEQDGRIVATDPTSGVSSVITGAGAPAGAPEPSGPTGIAIEPSGSLILADPDADATRGVIWRVDPATGAREVLAASGVPNAGSPGPEKVRYVEVMPDGRIFLIRAAFASPGGGVLERLNPSGTRSGVASTSELTNARDLTAAPDGSLIVADENGDVAGDGRVLRVAPTSGAVTPIASSTVGSGAPLDDPIGVAVDPAGVIYVLDSQLSIPDGETGLDSGTGAVIRIDPATGVRTVLSPSRPGDSFVAPQGIAFEPNAPANGGPRCSKAKKDLSTVMKQLKKAKKQLANAGTPAQVSKAKKKVKKLTKAVKTLKLINEQECV